MKKIIFFVMLFFPIVTFSQKAPLPADSLTEKTVLIKPKAEQELLNLNKEQQAVSGRAVVLDEQIKKIISIILENDGVDDKDVYDLKYEPGKFVLKLHKRSKIKK